MAFGQELSLSKASKPGEPFPGSIGVQRLSSSLWKSLGDGDGLVLSSRRWFGVSDSRLLEGVLSGQLFMKASVVKPPLTTNRWTGLIKDAVSKDDAISNHIAGITKQVKTAYVTFFCT